MDILRLNGMRFYAYHGVFEQERKEGQPYEVDVELQLDLKKCCESDCLDDGLDYGAVYQTVAREMAVPSDLIEHVAQRICDSIRREYLTVSQVRVRLRKPHPPIASASIANAEVEIIR